MIWNEDFNGYGTALSRKLIRLTLWKCWWMCAMYTMKISIRYGAKMQINTALQYNLLMNMAWCGTPRRRMRMRYEINKADECRMKLTSWRMQYVWNWHVDAYELISIWSQHVVLYSRKRRRLGTYGWNAKRRGLCMQLCAMKRYGKRFHELHKPLPDLRDSFSPKFEGGGISKKVDKSLPNFKEMLALFEKILDL